MGVPDSIKYIDAKARVVRALGCITMFTKASNEYLADQTSTSKRAKIETMFLEINEMRAWVDQDIQIMETAVGSKTSPADVTDNTCSMSLIDSFDQLYYDLIAVAHLHNISIVKQLEIPQPFTNHQPIQSGNSSIY